MADNTAKFLRIYANVPDKLRNDIIAVEDKRPYTWNTAYLEVKDNTNLGRKILKTLEEIGVL